MNDGEPPIDSSRTPISPFASPAPPHCSDVPFPQPRTLARRDSGCRPFTSDKLMAGFAVVSTISMAQRAPQWAEQYWQHLGVMNIVQRQFCRTRSGLAGSIARCNVRQIEPGVEEPSYGTQSNAENPFEHQNGRDYLVGKSRLLPRCP